MATEKGVKLDQGKPDVDLVLGGFARALLEVSKVGTFGAEKYTRYGFLDVPNGEERYDSAGLRHYLEKKKGNPYDKESGLLHAAHSAWCSLANLELYLRRREIEMSNQQDAQDLLVQQLNSEAKDEWKENLTMELDDFLIKFLITPESKEKAEGLLGSLK